MRGGFLNNTKIILFIVAGIIACIFTSFITNKEFLSNITGTTVPKSDTVVVVKKIHDTLRVTIPYEKIKVGTVIKHKNTSSSVNIQDTIQESAQDTIQESAQDTIQESAQDIIKENAPPDTQVCYESNVVEKDSAGINISVCSDSFPKQKPIDLSFHVNYIPAPIKQITITKDLYHFYPIYKDWRTYALMGATFALGAYFSKWNKW
jgi:hypothetical protein